MDRVQLIKRYLQCMFDPVTYGRGTGWNKTVTIRFIWLDANVTATDNGDGTWSRTVTPAPTSDVNYVWIVDGVQENLLAANAAGCDAFVQGTTFNTDGANYATDYGKLAQEIRVVTIMVVIQPI